MNSEYCVSCKNFYCKAEWLNMCSVCYKNHINKEKINKEINNFVIPQIPETIQNKIINHSKCFKCSKKIGLLGFLCNGCEYSYCNGHRLPENHCCQRDYSSLAKSEMKKQSINITAPKIQKIE